MARDALVASCQCVATTPLEKKIFILFEYVRYFRKRGASMVVRTRANDVNLIAPHNNIIQSWSANSPPFDLESRYGTGKGVSVRERPTSIK